MPQPVVQSVHGTGQDVIQAGQGAGTAAAAAPAAPAGYSIQETGPQ